jgi:hypothetical protein
VEERRRSRGDDEDEEKVEDTVGRAVPRSRPKTPEIETRTRNENATVDPSDA